MDHTLHSLASEEIQSTLEKASLFGGKIAQPSSTLNPQSLILRLDIDSSGMLFMKLQNKIELEKERPITINLNYRNLSFFLSSGDYTVEGETIIGQIPKTAKAIALRGNERYAFPLDQKVVGNIRRIEKRGAPQDLEMQLVDVSKQGLGFIIHEGEEQCLLPHDHLWVQELNGVKLERPIFGRVVYTFERKYKDSTELKCGLSLQEEIPEDVFLNLQKLCRLVLKA